MESTCRLAHLSVCICVCLSVRKVYCSKTAVRIRMPFGMVSGVSGGLGVVDGMVIVCGLILSDCSSATGR